MLHEINYFDAPEVYQKGAAFFNRRFGSVAASLEPARTVPTDLRFGLTETILQSGDATTRANARLLDGHATVAPPRLAPKVHRWIAPQ
ncbi:MAG: hypothetical protein AAF334_03680 [Pseudomonadota bacterium]